MQGITNAQKAGGGGSATINYFDITTTTNTLDTQLTLGNSVYVFKNGVLLQGGSGNDYTISSSVITFTTALVNGDKIAVVNGDLIAIDLTNYMLKPIIVNNPDNTNLVIEENKIYKFNSPISSLNIINAVISDYESRIYFSTDNSNSIIFEDNSPIRWGGGNQQPELEPNTVYCIAICNGLAEIDTFGTTGA